MRKFGYAKKLCSVLLASLFSVALIVPATLARSQAPPSYSPDELDKLVSRVALYPDPLLAQVLTAATYPDQIPDAATWADQHHYLTGADLSNAITSDQLPWDPSVQGCFRFRQCSIKWLPI
jgi:Protein of unknown function (DUF3300)